MRRYIRSLIISMLSVSIFFGLALSVSAASSQGGALADKEVNGSVNINSNGASAQTYISNYPENSSTTVKLSYSYINTQTNEITTVTKIGTGTNLANLNLFKPSQPHYKSLEATATHIVSYDGQSWTTHTNYQTAFLSLSSGYHFDVDYSISRPLDLYNINDQSVLVAIESLLK